MEQTTKHKTCAVVVTHNRRALLERCLAALKQQSAPCDVLVVDNASTDGTERWLAEQAAQDSRLRLYRSAENLGGAGGFHTGMRLALEAGYEWLWIMDDDSLAAPTALEIQSIFN